jgi:hypothetical protein
LARTSRCAIAVSDVRNARALGDAEPAGGLEAQRHARIRRQRRMTAHEHHAQLVVLEIEHDRRGRVGLRGALQLARDLVGARAEERRPADDVQRAVPRHAKQPARRVRRHAGVRPLLQRFDQRVLHDFFDQLQVRGTEDARQPGDQPARAVAEQMVDELMRRAGTAGVFSRHGETSPRYIVSICRTSIVPPYSRCGQSRA